MKLNKAFKIDGIFLDVQEQWMGNTYSLKHHLKADQSFTTNIINNINKHQYSIILLVLFDQKYCFTYIDVGANGKASDGGVF